MASKLTDIAIRNAKPRERKYKLAAGNGLTLMVMPDGAKYWRWRYRFAGKQKEYSVGRPYPQTSLKEAHEEAARLRVQLVDGADPGEVRKQKKLALKERADNTLAGAANAWYEFRKDAWAQRTCDQVREYLDKDIIPKLGKRPLDFVTTAELAAFLKAIRDRGAPDIAKKARQWLAAIFSYARANGMTQSDPIKDLHALLLPSPPGSPYAHLELDELPELLRKLEVIDASPLVKAATKLSLWTANRPGVTRTLLWSELDLDEGLWHIEKGREGMKRGYSHITPLPTQAVALLREIHKLTGNYEYVFAGRNDPSKPISDGSVNGLLKRLGYRGRQTNHGFRHLISTALNGMGYDKDHVERQLAHGDPDDDVIRETYNKAMYIEERREMMQAWADYLDQLRDGVVAAPKSYRRKTAPNEVPTTKTSSRRQYK